MARSSLSAAAVLLLISACGATAPGSTQGPTTASVAVQPGDLPSGMHKCDLSGDVDSFVSKLKSKDPNIATKTKTEWDAAKKDGATAVYIAFYADSDAHCTSIASSTSDIGSTTYRLVINFVIQFKDAASANKGYATETIFGFDNASLKGGGAPVQEGAATGLGANSIVLDISVANQAFYVARWQHSTFLVTLYALNVDAATDRKVAVAEDSRIK